MCNALTSYTTTFNNTSNNYDKDTINKDIILHFNIVSFSKYMPTVDFKNWAPYDRALVIAAWPVVEIAVDHGHTMPTHSSNLPLSKTIPTLCSRIFTN